MAHVLILVHRHGSFDKPRYFMREIAEVWRAHGHQISVAHGPPAPGRRIAADAAVLHVDLTVVPEDHLEFLGDFPVVINGRVKDISKRAISRNILHQGDDYDGPVIVKTDRNYGGIMEAQLAARTGGRAPSFTCEPKDYSVYRSPRDVPQATWGSADLVVEKFLAEQRDGCYSLRTWVFIGNRETNSLSWARQPIVKSDAVIRREPVAEVPAELREIRQSLGFDFGKFDYGIVDGRVVLYDANRTPAVGNFSREQFMPRIRLLAEGLAAFL
jgi:hypothetical protein